MNLSREEEQELEVLEAHMDELLDSAYHRMGVESPRHNGRPVVVMVREEVQRAGEDDALVYVEAWRAFLEILFATGPRPDRVMKRLFALVWAVNRERLANMSQTDLALMMKETRAATQLRIRLLYTDFLKSRGFRGTRVPGQKSETASRISAAKAKGNTNRKSGRKKGDIRNQKLK